MWLIDIIALMSKKKTPTLIHKKGPYFLIYFFNLTTRDQNTFSNEGVQVKEGLCALHWSQNELH